MEYMRDHEGDERIRAGGHRSLWVGTAPDTGFPPLAGDVEVDVAVIGGGIAGVTTASLLKEGGATVALIDMHRLARLTTGHTTAKITALQGITYSKLAKRFGREGARTYAEASQAAIEQIASTVERKGIDCDFERMPMYAYTEKRNRLQQIESEAQAAQEAGLPASFTEETPLPFAVAGAVRLDNQAQFHPRKYVQALAQELPGDGSHVFEETRALDIKKDETHTVITTRGTVRAKHVVLATLFPFYDTGFFFSRLFPYHTYAIAVRINGEPPPGMYYTEEHNIYAIRTQPIEDGTALVISGGNHKTGQGGDTLRYYKRLDRQTHERFDVSELNYYWSTHDYDTPDLIPYIGKAPFVERIYVATGFAGWGMTNGTIAATIIADEILGRQNRWADFFSPARVNLPGSAVPLVAEGANVTRQYISGLLIPPKQVDPATLATNEGAKTVINRREYAVYNDQEGRLHKLSPVCQHLACIVNWNNAEKTWDCPCHGSRYRATGEVLYGPTTQGLREKDEEQGSE